jgi:DNA-binding Xre family transcriptional regulator
MKDNFTTSSENSQTKFKQLPEPVEWSAYQMMCKLRRSQNPRHKNSTLKNLANAMGISTTRLVRLLQDNCVKITAVEYYKLEQIYIKTINEKGKL